jgi:holo-[acyl-carrier protein] synthase
MIVGLGIDVVDIPRARRLLSTYGDRFLARVCTAAEAEYIRLHVDGGQRLAARLAAKEAAFKALAGSPAARGIGWREIEIIAADGGPPSLALHGPARERASAMGAERWLLSITHGDSTAVAVVVMESGAGT